MAYTKFSEKQIDFNNPTAVKSIYEQGFLFGRVRPGYVYQTRSLRLRLNDFQPNSENRRIMRKLDLEIDERQLPFSGPEYDWRIQKQAKDFYSEKFPDQEFSAAKIRELLKNDSNFNTIFSYSTFSEDNNFERVENNLASGHAICYKNSEILHYCYPFYDLTDNTNNLGMRMMIETIIYAQMYGLSYVYLGGVTRPADKYKLQFQGLEWWDNESQNWSNDLINLKEIIA